MLLLNQLRSNRGSASECEPSPLQKANQRLTVVMDVVSSLNALCLERLLLQCHNVFTEDNRLKVVVWIYCLLNAMTKTQEYLNNEYVKFSGAYTSLLSLAPRFTPTLSSISVSVSMLAQLTTPFIVAAVKSTVGFELLISKLDPESSHSDMSRYFTYLLPIFITGLL